MSWPELPQFWRLNISTFQDISFSFGDPENAPSLMYMYDLINVNKQVWMRLDDEDKRKGLQLVPESYGMDVPSACTIVIIAGK